MIPGFSKGKTNSSPVSPNPKGQNQINVYSNNTPALTPGILVNTDAYRFPYKKKDQIPQPEKITADCETSNAKK